jgi:pyruvate kinase
MDLGGPKLRTGTMACGRSVLRIKPLRDDVGQVLIPARVGMRVAGSTMPVAGAAAHIGVEAAWLSQLKLGDHIDLTDARGADRELLVVHRDEGGVLAECTHTAYLVPETRLERRRKGRSPRVSVLADLPCKAGTLHLERGAIMHLTRDAVDPPLPEVFGQVCVGERIWFDDGRIGGVIRRVEPEWLEVEIVRARDSGETLAADKGINLPDSQLSLPALTAKDRKDLAVVVKVADLVGLSFVHQAADIDALRTCLRELGRPNLGIMLKIETRRAFENLPELLFSAMASKAAGIMIARGDLAVECGYER